MRGVSADDSSRLIASEEKRLEEVKRNEKIRENGLYQFIDRELKGTLPFDVFVEAVKKAQTFDDFVKIIPGEELQAEMLAILKRNPDIRDTFNEMRALLGVPPISPPKGSTGRTQRSKHTRDKRRTG